MLTPDDAAPRRTVGGAVPGAGGPGAGGPGAVVPDAGGPGGATHIIVTVADGAAGDDAALDAVTQRLRGGGVDVDQVLRLLGVITGWAGAGWETLTALDGVAAVERDRTVRLPPPGAPQ